MASSLVKLVVQSLILTAAVAQSPTVEVATLGTPPTQIAYDEARQRLLVLHSTGMLQEFDGATWALCKPRVPGAAVLEYDPVRQRCYFVSGAVQEYEGHSVRTLASGPPGSLRCLVADGLRGRLVGLRSPLAGTGVSIEEFDGSQWTTVAAIPGWRAIRAACFDRQRNCMVMLVQNTLPTSTGETWEWNGSALVGPLGDGQLRQLVAYDPTLRLVVSTLGAATDVWDGVAWTRLPNAAAPTDLTALTTDAVGRRVIGCEQGASGAMRFWEWNGATWRLGTPAPQPVGSGVMHYHAGLASVVFCGDAGGGAERRQFAAWDGAKWQPLGLAGAAPATLLGAASAYDPARGEWLVFGGKDPGTGAPNGLLHAFAASGWRQVAATGPSPRWRSSMAFDAGRGRMALVGGTVPGSGTQLQDHWEWDGATWTLVSPTMPFGAVTYALGYDPVRARLVAHARDFPSFPFGFTAEFGSAGWQIAHLGYGPALAATDFPMLAWNPQRNALQAVMVSYDSQLVPMVHAWDGTSWALHDDPVGGLAFDPVRGSVVLHRGRDTAVVSALHAAADDVGVGCGAAGREATLTAFRMPRLGDGDFHLDLRAEAGMRPALLGFGLALGAVPIGNGCVFRVQNPLWTQVWFTDANGFWHHRLPLPQAAALRGMVLHAQGAVVDPAVPGGFALTQGLSLRLGD